YRRGHYVTFVPARRYFTRPARLGGLSGAGSILISRHRPSRNASKTATGNSAAQNTMKGASPSRRCQRRTKTQSNRKTTQPDGPNPSCHSAHSGVAGGASGMIGTQSGGHHITTAPCAAPLAAYG